MEVMIQYATYTSGMWKLEACTARTLTMDVPGKKETSFKIKHICGFIVLGISNEGKRVDLILRILTRWNCGDVVEKPYQT